jgi:hypothetical protein
MSAFEKLFAVAKPQENRSTFPATVEKEDLPLVMYGILQ